jgi:DNA-binding transcriptional LysR family regulator
VTFEPTLPVGRHLRRYLRENGVTPRITNVFDNIDTIKSAVAVTNQVSILPKRTVLREVAANTLAVIDLLPSLHRPLGIIFHRRGRTNATFSPTAQAFVDFLLEHTGPRVDVIDQVQLEATQLEGTRG